MRCASPARPSNRSSIPPPCSRGYKPETIVKDAPISIGNWSPKNYGGRFAGNVTLTTALIRSLNTVAVRLAGVVGRETIIDLAHRMGITTKIINSKSLPLGATDVRVVDMTGAYAVFAGGFRATPWCAHRDYQQPGRGGVRPQARRAGAGAGARSGYRRQDEHHAVAGTERGTGRAAKPAGIKTAGKTGTTNAYRERLFAGFTAGNYVGGVWFGNDDFTSSKEMTGGSLPARPGTR